MTSQESSIVAAAKSQTTSLFTSARSWGDWLASQLQNGDGSRKHHETHNGTQRQENPLLTFWWDSLQDLCPDSHCTPEHPILDYDEDNQSCLCSDLSIGVWEFQGGGGVRVENLCHERG